MNPLCNNKHRKCLVNIEDVWCLHESFQICSNNSKSTSERILTKPAGKKPTVCQVQFNKFSLMFIHTYISRYVYNIENPPFFLVGVFLLYMEFMVHLDQEMWKKSPKNHQTPAQHQRGSSTLQLLLQNYLCVLRSKVTVLIRLNLSVVTNSW